MGLKARTARLEDRRKRDRIRREVERVVDRVMHGTKEKIVANEPFDAIVRALEAADEGAISIALRKASDVPGAEGLTSPRQLFRNKAGLIEAATSAPIVEHRAVAIEVLSIIDPAASLPLCVELARRKRSPSAYRCKALRALGSSDADVALDTLLEVVFGKMSGDPTDPVTAALHALARSPNRDAAARTLAAVPALAGKRGDTCLSRAIYVVLSHRATHVRDTLTAMAPSAPYLIEAAMSCLDGGHTGNFQNLSSDFR